MRRGIGGAQWESNGAIHGPGFAMGLCLSGLVASAAAATWLGSIAFASAIMISFTFSIRCMCPPRGPVRNLFYFIFYLFVFAEGDAVLPSASRSDCGKATFGGEWLHLSCGTAVPDPRVLVSLHNSSIVCPQHIYEVYGTWNLC